MSDLQITSFEAKSNNIILYDQSGEFLRITSEGAIILSEQAKNAASQNPDPLVQSFIEALEKSTGRAISERPRVQELLEANTRYLLRARKAEELLKKLFTAMPKGTLLSREVKLHMEEPWK